MLVTSFSSPARLSLVNMANPARPMVDPVLVEGGKVFSVPRWVGDGAIIVAVVQTWASTDVALVDVSNPAKATIKQKLFSKDGRMFPYYPVYHAATKRCVFAGREHRKQLRSGPTEYLLSESRTSGSVFHISERTR